jgi:hypothetical protein
MGRAIAKPINYLLILGFILQPNLLALLVNFHFARKFEPQPDNKILDLLDELVDAKVTAQ